MPYSDQQVSDKIETTIEAWEANADDNSFAGMTFAQFKAKVKPSLDARTTIATLRLQLQAALKNREDSDTVSWETCALVVKAVRGDVEFGEDSALYKALGYIPTSERRSGLQRKNALKKAA